MVKMDKLNREGTVIGSIIGWLRRSKIKMRGL